MYLQRLSSNLYFYFHVFLTKQKLCTVNTKQTKSNRNSVKFKILTLFHENNILTQRDVYIFIINVL